MFLWFLCSYLHETGTASLQSRRWQLIGRANGAAVQMRPSIAHANRHWTIRHAVAAHHRSNQPHCTFTP